MARPTKYKSEYCGIAKKMCELGATDTDVAEALDVNLATVNRWKLAHSDFCESLKAGKVPADQRVEASLYRKAVGYEIDNVKIFQFQGEPVEVPFREYIHPDTTAAIFWLKNRMPDKYRQNPEEKANPDALINALMAMADKLPG